MSFDFPFVRLFGNFVITRVWPIIQVGCTSQMIAERMDNSQTFISYYISCHGESFYLCNILILFVLDNSHIGMMPYL